MKILAWIPIVILGMGAYVFALWILPYWEIVKFNIKEYLKLVFAIHIVVIIIVLFALWLTWGASNI